MARFLVWTDLHDEFWEGFDLPALDQPVDGVLIAGDTNTLGRHLDIPVCAARAWDCPVIVIRGNHEFYGSVMADIDRAEAERLAELLSEGLDIRVLKGGATEVAGVRIIGATLWTDLRLYPDYELFARETVGRVLRDYHVIETVPGRKLTIPDTLELHRRDRAAILTHLEQSFDGPTIVMTHFIPVRELIHPSREAGVVEYRIINAGFASNLWPEIQAYDIAAWVCGHSHDNRAWVGDGAHGPVRFVMNARGYPAEGCDFDPGFVLEV